MSSWSGGDPLFNGSSSSMLPTFVERSSDASAGYPVGRLAHGSPVVVQDSDGRCGDSTQGQKPVTMRPAAERADDVIAALYRFAAVLEGDVHTYPTYPDELPDLLAAHGMSVLDEDVYADFKRIVLHVVDGECLRDHAATATGCIESGGCWTEPASMGTAMLTALSNLTQRPRIRLDAVALVCSCFTDDVTGDGSDRRRRVLCRIIKERIAFVNSPPHPGCANLFTAFERCSKDQLAALAASHHIECSHHDTMDHLRSKIVEHLSSGACSKSEIAAHDGCGPVVNEFKSQGTVDELRIYVLSAIRPNIKKRPLKRVLNANNIPYEESDSLGRLRRRLYDFIRHLKKGKISEHRAHQRELARQIEDARVSSIRRNWPQIPSQTLKDRLVDMFKRDTSSDALRTFTCACCACEDLLCQKNVLALEDVPIHLLRFSPSMASPDEEYPVTPEMVSSIPLPYRTGPLAETLLDSKGVNNDTSGSPASLDLCQKCHSSLRRNKLPSLALANKTWLGPVPQELKDLTPVEESMIALCRAKAWILQLKDAENPSRLPGVQRGVRGHIIIRPQHPERIETVLPLPMEEVAAPICVIFVGSKPPTEEWLKEHARPLCVRRQKIRDALLWLKAHNPLYKNVEVDVSRIASLPVHDIVPVTAHHIRESDAQDVLTSRYDGLGDVGKEALDAGGSSTESNEDSRPVELGSVESSVMESRNEGSSGQEQDNTPRLPRIVNDGDSVAFESLVVTDVDGNAPADKLKAAAMRHFQAGGGHVEMPHDNQFEDEFFNPKLFPMVYPTLFPYGIGGFEDNRRSKKLSFKYHVKHLFNLADHRFQEHYSFMFTVFSVLQRRYILLHTGLKVKKSSYLKVATEIASVNHAAVTRVCEKLKGSEPSKQTYDTEERKVLKLMQELKFVTRDVPGSAAARLNMRNEIRGLTMELGLPSFYLTINPADVHNPLVRFLAGSDIEIDDLLPEQVTNVREQSILIARNPVAAARFFNVMMKAFIKNILGYENKAVSSGVLGVVKGYYGCVEAQGRGSLHCHMLVWLEGGLNPNEIRDKVLAQDGSDFAARLIAYLDDAISTAVPAAPSTPDPVLGCWQSGRPPHPCTVRDIVSKREERTLSSDTRNAARAHDLHRLAEKCQRHSHTTTCFKYCADGQPRVCRFDLDEDNTCAESSFDMNTGELTLRVLDGLVNNFNETILRAIRCNMDIKFIGSGDAAKAVLHYITDYIAKAQLQTHVAYAALELAVTKLDGTDHDSDEVTVRAKKLLRQCIYSIMSHQELSAQQVVSYNMGLEDHFTSHCYRQLYWASAERYIHSKDPSEDCLSSLTDPVDEESDQAVSNENPFADPADQTVPDAPDDVSDLSDNDDEDEDVPSQDRPTEDNEYDMPDEITVSASRATGELVPHSNQILDYVHRPAELDGLSFWDFVAQTEKIGPSAMKSKTSEVEDDSDDNEEQDDDTETNIPIERPDSSTHSSLHDLLNCTTRVRPTFPFITGHIEQGRKLLRIVHPRLRRVVVPIGPAIPRRDKPEVRARYCRLMLLLFKPWRTGPDLRETGETWETAFQALTADAEPAHLKIMENMHVLRECKDLRDEHYRTGKHQRRPRGLGAELGMTRNAETGDASVSSDHNQADLLRHLTIIDRTCSQKTIQANLSAAECVQSANIYDVFRFHSHSSDDPEVDDQPATSPDRSWAHEELRPGDTSYEDSWRLAYDRRKEAWKASQRIPMPITTEEIGNIAPVSSNRDPPVEYEQPPPVTEPRIVPGVPRRIFEQALANTLIKWTLNCEQTRAFRIIAEHSLANGRLPPLRMFINGSGGTGKSRVINALKDYFDACGQGRRFRLASYTGIAAKNIHGMTLHAALSLDDRRTTTRSSQSYRDLVAMWEGVDYFFIDEVSMISCQLLCKISTALNMAKGTDEGTDFGGINMIFAGDFAQLPPVGGKRLYAKGESNTAEAAGTQRGQNKVKGKILWNNITTVVTLKEIMRQSGNSNRTFVDLLSRLRKGRCTDDDYTLLKTRLVQHAHTNLTHPQWNDAPVIVRDNASKDSLNLQAVIKYSESTGQPWHWYYSTDRCGKQLITEEVLQHKLSQQHSGQTRQRLYRVPLALGMRVIVCTNFDVNAGIVNGSIGELRRIRYTVDNQGRRHVTSCIVHLPDVSGDGMPNLGDKEYPILADTTDIIFKHPWTKKSITIKRTQIPLVPAYAMTAHKAQGQTFSNVILDIQSCQGSESPYVMLSRATSLDGVMILRPFDKGKVKCNRTEYLRRECDERLPLLTLRTIIEYGHGDEVQVATMELEVLQRATDQRRLESYTRYLTTQRLPNEASNLSQSGKRLHEPTQAGTQLSKRARR